MNRNAPFIQATVGSPMAPLPTRDAVRNAIIGAAVFTRPKPVNASARYPAWASKMPDLSKLLRSTEDALTTSGVWTDDGRVVAYRLLAKVYPGEGSLWPGCPDLSLPEPGARIILWTAPAPQAALPIGEA